MRSFSKKLAFVLAAAMVVTSFAPAASAKAAGEMAINKSSQILYVNEGINHKGAEGVAAGKGNVSVYDFSVKNKPADWKDTLSFKWTSSDEDVVTVKAGGVATAVSVGKATITCKVTDKATKETVATLKTKITVKANADEVEIINADDVAGLAYEIGATVDLNRAMYDENGNKTTKRGTVVTDYTRWIAEPSNGVTIDQKSGKYTFAEAGEFTLYCETYQSSKYTKTTATSEKITVTVADTGLELKQTTRVKFTINFGSAVEALAVEDVNVDELVAVAQGTDKVNYLVKSVTLAENKKSADVEVFYAFNDGATYEVTVKGYDTEKFVASNGAPKSAVLHSDKYNTAKRNVVVDNNSPIYATLYDANGIDVTTNALLERLTFIVKYVDSDFETSDTSLYFAEVGERAVVKVEYHTYEYDDNGEEKDAFVSAPYTFVAVARAQSGVEKIVKYVTNGNLESNTNDVKMETIVTDNKLAVRIKLVEDTDSNALIDLTEFNQLILSEDKSVTLGKANFTSLVPDVLEVYDAGDSVHLYPRKVGTGRIMVSYITDVNGYDVETAIGIVEVKVQAEMTLTYVKVGDSVVVCANPVVADNHTEAVENPFVRIQVAHQYAEWDDNYPADKWTVKVEGTNALSKRAVEDGALEWDDNHADYAGGPKGYIVKNRVFLDILDDMDGNGTKDVDEKKTETKASRFTFKVTVTDKKTYATKSVTFSVDARRAVDINNDKDANNKPIVNEKDMTVQLVTDASTVKNNGNNVGRYNTFADNSSMYYNIDTEQAKSVTFSAYYVNNGAKWDEIEIAGVLPKTEDIPTAATGFYYVVNKGGKNISTAPNVVETDNGTGNKYTLNFSKDQVWDADEEAMVDVLTKVKDNVSGDVLNIPVTSYEEWNAEGVNTMGAGTYEFILYEIINKDGVNKVVRKASSALSVSCDFGGSYKLTGRNSVSVSVAENDVKFQKELLNCFSFVDKDGVTFDSWKVNDDNSVIFKNGQQRKFYVTLNAEKAAARPGTVYVESVTFWEPTGWKHTDAQTTYFADVNRWAEYTVPVGYFVTLP